MSPYPLLLRNLVWIAISASVSMGMMMPVRRSMMRVMGTMSAGGISFKSRTLGGIRRSLSFLSQRGISAPFGSNIQASDTRLRISPSDTMLAFDEKDQEEDIFADEIMEAEEEEEDVDETEEPRTLNLPKGTSEGFYIVKTYQTEGEGAEKSSSGFDMEKVQSLVDMEDIERLGLNTHNISVPVALMILDEVDYPSISRARKACRKANIVIHRGPLQIDQETGIPLFDITKCIRARVGDRLFPGDVLGKQIRMGDGYSPVMNHKRPPFDLPVIYEDDHFAICNKPAGVVVYAQRGGGHGLMTIRAALPFAVTPPKLGTVSTMRRPQPVHRLDKPTSGLLIVAKTKPAMVDLSTQFRDRIVKKSYTAIVNGIPPEPQSTKVTSTEAHAMGVDVDPDDSSEWQLIDHPLDEKSAVTVWRAVRYAKSLKAQDNYITLVELKPKTGRYHQLRRHMVRTASGRCIYV